MEGNNLDNRYRAMLFFAVMFFVLIIVTFYTASQTFNAAGSAVQFQQQQLNISKACANNCDALAEAGQLNCDWIVCHERCQVGILEPYCNQAS